MMLWLNSKLPTGKLRKLLPMDLEYLVTYMSEKERRKERKCDLTRRNFLSPMNSE